MTLCVCGCANVLACSVAAAVAAAVTMYNCVVLVMPVIQPSETVLSAVGWSTQSLQQPTDTSRAGRIQPVDVRSLSESSSSMASEPVNDLLAQPSEHRLLLFGFSYVIYICSRLAAM